MRQHTSTAPDEASLPTPSSSFEKVEQAEPYLAPLAEALTMHKTTAIAERPIAQIALQAENHAQMNEILSALTRSVAYYHYAANQHADAQTR